MSIKLNVAAACAAMAVGCAMMLPGDAAAQPGSRLCGWETSSVTAPGNKPMTNVHVALVY